jgi:hypothetical protein
VEDWRDGLKKKFFCPRRAARDGRDRLPVGKSSKGTEARNGILVGFTLIWLDLPGLTSCWTPIEQEETESSVVNGAIVSAFGRKITGRRIFQDLGVASLGAEERQAPVLRRLLATEWMTNEWGKSLL